MAANKLAKVTTRAQDVPSTAPFKPTAEDKERQRRYQAEDALRCLTRAEEIREDKSLMDDVRCLVKEQMETLKKFK